MEDCDFISFLIIINNYKKTEDNNVLYELEITRTDNDEQVKKYERYSTLLNLHNNLVKECKKKCGNFPKFPPKKLIGSTKDSFIKQRLKDLKIYFINLCSEQEIVKLPSFQTYIKSIFFKMKKSNNKKEAKEEKVRNLTEQEKIERGKEIVKRIFYCNLNKCSRADIEISEQRVQKYSEIIKVSGVFKTVEEFEGNIWEIKTSGFSLPDGKDDNFRTIEERGEKIWGGLSVLEGKIEAKIKEFRKKLGRDVENLYQNDMIIRTFKID